MFWIVHYDNKDESNDIGLATKITTDISSTTNQPTNNNKVDDGLDHLPNRPNFKGILIPIIPIVEVKFWGFLMDRPRETT